MFDKPDDRWTDTEKLLWCILNELRKPTVIFEAQKILDGSNDITTNKKTVEMPFKCKVCGTGYENKGQLMACAKKHKKGE